MILRAWLPFALVAALTLPARADDANAGPCALPPAAAVADRPGTGRTTSSGGSPCVALPGDVIVETGLRRQVTASALGRSILVDAPLTFLRAGVAPRLEIGIVPPAPQWRSITGAPPFDAARGASDTVIAAKVLITNTNALQTSVGFAYAPPMGTGEFTAGAPTYALTLNAAIALSSRFSVSTSDALGTSVGPDALGANRTYAVFAPSLTFAYAIDAASTLLVQDAFVSRQGPVLSAGSRGFIALQHAMGNRIVADIEYEINLGSLNGPSHAFGLGVVWIAARLRH